MFISLLQEVFGWPADSFEFPIMLHALLNGIIGIDDLTREVVEDHFMATKIFTTQITPDFYLRWPWNSDEVRVGLASQLHRCTCMRTLITRTTPSPREQTLTPIATWLYSAQTPCGKEP